jgi:hypothetical protein
MTTLDTRRPHRTRRCLQALPLCVAALLAGAVASAQTSSPEDIAAARVLGIEGTRLADAGDCAQAIAKLEAAEKLYHAPTTLDRLGECQISVGRLVAGTENLNRLVRESLPANAPSAFVAARKRGQQALSTALPRIGSLRIHVDGAPADQVTVTVDRAPASTALLDADRPTDPGTHEVAAGAAGYKTATMTVTVREGGESTVSLKLDRDLTAFPAAPPSEPAPQPVGVAPPSGAAQSSGGSDHRGIAFAAFGVGGVGLAIGTVFGVLALSTKSTLDGECTNKTCPAQSKSDIDSLQSKSTISTVGFGVGLVGVAVGAILLVTSHRSESPAATEREAPRPRPSPWVSLGAAGVGVTFE